MNYANGFASEKYEWKRIGSIEVMLQHAKPELCWIWFPDDGVDDAFGSHESLNGWKYQLGMCEGGGRADHEP